MKTVFLGGSRRVSRLNEEIRRRLYDLVQRNFEILVGDANGADRAMQRQLAEWGYRSVKVYFVGALPRNNEGAWSTERIATPLKARGSEFYSVKDRQMARDAECGLMLWDGKSRGTIANVERLVEANKPVSIYVAPVRRFVNVLNEDDLAGFRISLGLRGAHAKEATKVVQEDLGAEFKRGGKKPRRYPA